MFERNVELHRYSCRLKGARYEKRRMEVMYNIDHALFTISSLV